MLLASLRDCGKTYRSPFPVIGTPRPQVADDSFLPPFPWRTSVVGADLPWPQKQKGKEEGEAEAPHIHTRSPHPKLGSPTSVLHPPNTPSSAPYFSSRACQLTSSTSFLFHGYWWWAGLYSWDDEFNGLLLLILNWSVSTGIHSAFTQTNRSGAEAGGYGECRWLVSWPGLHYHYLKGSHEGQILLNNFHKVEVRLRVGGGQRTAGTWLNKSNNL